MKKTIVLLLLALFTAPAFALADSTVQTQPTVLQLLTRVAALEAEEAATNATSSVACAALTNVQTIPAGQPFILAWGSVGALSPGASSTQSLWTPAGASSVTQQTPGDWVYSLIFYGTSGGSATCTASIKVTS